MHSAPFLALLRRSRRPCLFSVLSHPIPEPANQIAVLHGQTLVIRLVDIAVGKDCHMCLLKPLADATHV
jgi:hypothetical protein